MAELINLQGLHPTVHKLVVAQPLRKVVSRPSVHRQFNQAKLWNNEQSVEKYGLPTYSTEHKHGLEVRQAKAMNPVAEDGLCRFDDMDNQSEDLRLEPKIRKLVVEERRVR